MTDIPPTKGDAHRIAIIITGDGGWAGLDRGVADALNADGVRVIGFSTLKFFWHKQTPDAAAEAIARVIAHYGKADPRARFVLIGYSFGASLVPVVANRLPDEARERVDGGVLISPDDEAVFEIHVGDWFGSTHHDEAMPIGPEMAGQQGAARLRARHRRKRQFLHEAAAGARQGRDVAWRASLQRGLHGAGGVDRQNLPGARRKR